MASLGARAPWSVRDWLRLSNVVGIVAALLTCVLVNCLAVGSNRRWDVTSDHRFTLSTSTRGILAAMMDRVCVHVLISRSDPLAPLVNPWLAAYQSSSKRLSVQWTDPDRDPAKFLALESRLGIAAGASKDGRSLTDAVIVLERGARKHYVTAEDLFQVDADSGDAQPRIEQALAEGIRLLLDDTLPVICFTRGHRELGIDDKSPTGLSELKVLMQRSSLDLKTVALQTSEQEKLSDCNLLVLAEPEIAFSQWERAQISKYGERSGALWIMSGTVSDQSGQVKGTELADLLPQLGVSLGNNVVIEEDERYRLPDGVGESFLARVTEHPVTHSLRRGTDQDSLRVYVSLAPTIEVASGAPVRPLLRSSETAHAVLNVSSYLSLPASSRTSEPGRVYTLAIASALESTPGTSKRRVVVSPASVATNRALRQPTLVGNRAFVDGVLSWLLARSAAADISASAKAVPEFALTAADVNRIDRYVLIVLPGAAIVLALAISALQRKQTRRL